jgi:Tfp pilus assembly protein PilN
MKAVNLLPGEHRGPARTPAAALAAPKSQGTPFGAYVILGILAVAVAATALLVLAGNTVKQREAELHDVTAQAAATKAKAASLQSFADFDSLATQRVDTVRSLASTRFDWDRSLADLARALPADVHLRAIDGSTVAGTGGGSLRGSIQAPAIELTGCATSQVSVANLMSRLRNVRGVTRVALSTSAEADPVDSSATTTSPTAGTEARPAQLCPKGSPPDFDVTMFFERAALPAGAAVNPGAASTTTASATATPAATPAGGTPASASTTTTTSTQGGTP